MVQIQSALSFDDDSKAPDYAINTVNHPFPSTRYQGSKYKITEWIVESLKKLDFETSLDAFGGTGVIAHAMKRMGKTVTYNDVLLFNSIIGKALIENNSVTLSDDKLNRLFDIPQTHPTFIEDTFGDIYFTDEENKWLDGFVSNVRSMDDEYEQAIAYFGLFQACISKRPYNLFHRANLYVRTSDVKRSFGNKATWEKPFPQAIKAFVKEANKAVFSNGKQCLSINNDIMDVSSDYDLVYIDTPYIDSKGISSNYMDYYHFLEGIVDYDNWPKRIDEKYKNKKIKDHACDKWTDFHSIKTDFENLIEKFKDSTMVISYRSDGIPSLDELKAILLSYKPVVDVKMDEYQYALSDKKTHEVLLIARDKTSND